MLRIVFVTTDRVAQIGSGRIFPRGVEITCTRGYFPRALQSTSPVAHLNVVRSGAERTASTAHTAEALRGVVADNEAGAFFVPRRVMRRKHHRRSAAAITRYRHPQPARRSHASAS